MPATETQIARFRRYFNDTDEAVFDDDEINDIFDEVAEYVTGNDRLTMVEAKIMGVDNLLMDAAKRVSYKKNATTENESDIFKHLKQMRDLLVADRASLETLAAGSAIRMAKTKVVPARKKDVPSC